jgi:hypothetical protein
MAAGTDEKRVAGRWFRRRGVVLPTWRSVVAGLVVLGLAGWWAAGVVHPWLCVSEEVSGARYAAVEGWAPDYVLAAAGESAEEGGVKVLYTTGLPLERGGHLVAFKDYATLAARSLVAMGYEAGRIAPVPSEAVATERTRAMAEALRAALALEKAGEGERTINVFTLGTHARRSRKIYQEVLGPEWRVGVVSVPNRAYQAGVWYRSSEGVKNVLGEVSALMVQ